MLSASGCARQHFAESVALVADRQGVRDAATLTVAGKGHLRFDTALRSDLDDAIAANDLGTVQELGSNVLHNANARAIAATGREIDRMPAGGLEELTKQHRFTDAPTDTTDRRAYLKGKFDMQARLALDQDLANLASVNDLAGARALLSDLRERIELPVGDRGKTARVVFAAPLFLPASIGAEMAERQAMHRAVVADFQQVTRYRPDSLDVPGADGLAQADAASLARWYAPIFAQQFDPDAEYSASADRIGEISLSGSPDAIHVDVDVAKPVVYWTRLEAKIGHEKRDQLVYVAWYPNRPALAPNDSEAGRIDGVVVRITLDRFKRPAIYEFVRSCGCYHTLWISEFVEAEARKQFGPPVRDRRFAVQSAGKGSELFLPDLVVDDGSHPRRPVVFVSAGYHLVMGITPLSDDAIQGRIRSEQTYRLEPYGKLTHLPLGESVASMFGSDGLVHDAGRGEGWLLAPTGMLSAGQPRQLGTMKIRMDAYDYDDPRLLERNLKLPDEF